MPSTTETNSGQARLSRKSKAKKPHEATAALSIAVDNSSKADFQFTDDELAWAIRALTAARNMSDNMRRVSMQGFAATMEALVETNPRRPILRLIASGAK